MAREDFKGPLQNVSLRAAIRENADYQGNPAGALTEDEIAAMHHQVETALATTNGDTGACEITARQLALLLNAATETLQAS
jgi:sRNA-binding protein